MNLDFTVDIYFNLLLVLQRKQYNFCTVKEYFKSFAENTNKLVILRHDVDKKPQNSLQTAQIENELGIHATYYFRTLDCSFDKEIIAEIIDMDHEFGYHYEDLTLAKGNIQNAYKLFQKNLKKFRSVGSVSTICMHGSPLSKYDNRDIWNHYDYKSFGIIGEPYFDIDFSDIFYLTDTGRKWNKTSVSVRDKISNQENDKLTALSTQELIELAEKNKLPNRIMINTHPQRWTNNYFNWMQELILQNLKNSLKSLLINRRNTSR
jgi:hypothetical protein